LQPRSVSSSPTTGVLPSSFPISNRPNSDSSAAQPPGNPGTNSTRAYDNADVKICPTCPRCCTTRKVKRRAIPTPDQGQETFAQLDQWPGPRVTTIPRAIARIDHQSAGHLCLTVSAVMATTMEHRVVGNPVTSAATTYSSTTFPSATFPASLEPRSFPTGNAFPSQFTLNTFLWSTPAKENTVPFRQQSGQSPKVNISLRFPLLFRLPLVLFHLSMLKIYLYSNHRLLTEGVEAQRQHLFIFQHSSIQRRHISSGAMDKPPFLR